MIWGYPPILSQGEDTFYYGIGGRTRTGVLVSAGWGIWGLLVDNTPHSQSWVSITAPLGSLGSWLEVPAWLAPWGSLALHLAPACPQAELLRAPQGRRD